MKTEKRSKLINVRMTPGELAAIKDAAAQRWPGLDSLMSLSNTVRCMALIAAIPKQKG
jgi:hypothetical protein